MNRAKGAKQSQAGCDYYVGMEGGIELDSDGNMWCSAWMIVRSSVLVILGDSVSRSLFVGTCARWW